jgi:hypothetical protein
VNETTGLYSWKEVITMPYLKHLLEELEELADIQIVQPNRISLRFSQRIAREHIGRLTAIYGEVYP